MICYDIDTFCKKLYVIDKIKLVMGLIDLVINEIMRLMRLISN